MALNQNQRRIVIAAAAIFIAMGLYPPWTDTYVNPVMYREKPAGYAFIMAPPAPESFYPNYGLRIDITRLLLQWFILAAGTGGAVLLAREPRSE